MRYPEHLLKLIAALKRLPGVGSRTAERFAFHLLDWPEEKLREMAEVIQEIKIKLIHCSSCGALIGEEECSFCNLTKRSSEILCIVASPKDIFALEETREYRGLYHVLHSLFSPIHGKTIPAHILEKLKLRIEQLEIKEIIIALDSTLEGDATALYLKKELSDIVGITLSRLALGLPMGSSLDYIDGGTLARALLGRSGY